MALVEELITALLTSVSFSKFRSLATLTYLYGPTKLAFLIKEVMFSYRSLMQMENRANCGEELT
jgi:hypothetical protein